MRTRKSRSTTTILIVLFTVIFSLQSSANPQNKENEPRNETDGWFTIKSVAENVWCINDHGSDNIYLIAGEEKALLIDTGIGVADLDKTIKTLTNLPVIVVNTHAHPDHSGGNFQFSEIYAHPNDFEMIKVFSSEENQKSSIEYASTEYSNLEEFFIKDIENFNVPAMMPIKAGHIFDLGNRKLEVIEVPGHTKGSIVLLDVDNKLLFTGDNNNTMVWLFLDGCLPVETYLQSLQNLNKRNGDFNDILPGHGDVLDKSFLDELIICTQNIINGSCKGEKYESFAGNGMVCSYKRARVAFNPNNIFIKQ